MAHTTAERGWNAGADLCCGVENFIFWPAEGSCVYLYHKMNTSRERKERKRERAAKIYVAAAKQLWQILKKCFDIF